MQQLIRAGMGLKNAKYVQIPTKYKRERENVVE
jgi:hypothetical protein